MPRKVIFIADPGIDTSFALALALHDPNLDVLGIIPCAGNVSASRATINVNILLDQIDPPRRPRTATALNVNYDIDGTSLHGTDGLGNVNFPVLERHSQTPADKLLCELVREHPHEVSIVALGPVTTIARAIDRDPELPSLLDQLFMVGGTWRESGNTGPVSEFHFTLDPDSTRRMLHLGIEPTIIPLDLTRKLIYSPTELLDLPNSESNTTKFLRKILPHAIRASSHVYGIEGFHLKDVMGVVALSLTGSVRSEPYCMEIETKGEFTRGMLIVDRRKLPLGRPNAHLATDAAIGEIRQYITRTVQSAT
ncbi:MAG: nucleoside hydrolase [Fimbriiglobus sp.]